MRDERLMSYANAKSANERLILLRASSRCGAAAAASLGANLAAGAGKTYTSGMGFLAKKTADQSVAYMSQYFVTQGWIPQSMVKTADVGSSANY